jgi:hypothetical protein
MLDLLPAVTRLSSTLSVPLNGSCRRNRRHQTIPAHVPRTLDGPLQSLVAERSRIAGATSAPVLAGWIAGRASHWSFVLAPFRPLSTSIPAVMLLAIGISFHLLVMLAGAAHAQEGGAVPVSRRLQIGVETNCYSEVTGLYEDDSDSLLVETLIDVSESRSASVPLADSQLVLASSTVSLDGDGYVERFDSAVQIESSCGNGGWDFRRIFDVRIGPFS